MGRVALASVIGGLGGLLLGGAAAAQSTPPPAPPAKAETPSTVEELVVTGSHIRRSNFTSVSPIQVIVSDDSKAAGLFDPTDILQKSSIAAGAVQINNQFSGFVVNGGSGVDTISLRGLGADRTLVLLNGRRLNPAGVGGTVAAVDLNVIPNAMVDRYEILKDGASSVYGSDAIGGVVNIITRNRVEGLTLETSESLPLNGAGDQFIIDALAGHVADHYHISASLEYKRENAIKVGDLPGGQCPLELQRPPGGTAFNYGRVNPDGSPYCAFVQTDNVFTFGEGATYVFDPSLPPSFPFTPFVQDPFGTPVRHTNIATDPRERQVDAASPSEVLSATLFGGADLPHGMELSFEGLVTNRRSNQDAYIPQFFPGTDDQIIAVSFNPFNPFNDFVQPVVTLPIQKFSQDVTAGRALIELKGDFGGAGLKGWSWDTYASYGESSAHYESNPRLTSRVMNALDVVEAPAGFNPSLVRNNPVNGLNYTCAINITNPGEGCYPLNWFIGSAAFAGDPALKYITATDPGYTDYKQMIVDASMEGPLFNLPAGDVRGFFGAEFRYDKLYDNPGAAAIATDYFGQSTAGVTQGDESVEEVFGEIDAPILKGLPLAESLTVNATGRFTHYRTAGTGWTYKGSVNWQIIPSLRLRATYGTSYRGPALYENYLAAQVAFTGAVDPCINYGINAAPGSNLFKNCASEGLPATFQGYTGTPEVFSQGALGRLKPETSKNLTTGPVWTPSFADLQVSVDYFWIEIDNQIAQLGPDNLLNLCYESAAFRSGSAYCTLITPRDANGNIASIDDSYLNVAKEVTSGFDFTGQYRKRFNFGQFLIKGEGTYRLKDNQVLIPGTLAQEFNGVFGEPRLALNASVRFKRGDWSFEWTGDYLSGQEAYSLTGEDPAGRYNLHQDPQLYHSISVTYDGPNWRAILGIRNLLNSYPPVISNNPDTAFASRVAEFANGNGNLTLAGRSIFINLKKHF